MRIGILGIGAIGSVLSLKLTDNDDYFYFNRSVKKNIEVRFEERILQKIIELSKVNSSYNLDWLILCLKEYQFEEAQYDIEKLIGVQTKVIVIRNGIDLKAPILKYTKDENILECMIDCPVQKTNQGHFIQIHKPIITIKKGNLATEFKGIFREHQIEIKQVDDYKTQNWMKIIESSALGGLLALSGETTWIFQDQAVLELYKKVVEEGIEVAKKEGAKIDNEFSVNLISKLKAYPSTKGSSMLTDRWNGNPIEINAKNGIISKYGKKHRIKTEINDIIYTLLKYTNKNTHL